MKKALALAISVVLLVVSFAGCAQNPAAANAGDTKSGTDPAAVTAAAGTLQSRIDPSDEYVVVCCIGSIEFWNAHKYTWKQAGELYNVHTEWQGMPGDDVAEMVTLLDSVVAKSPKGIVVFGWDEGLAPSIDKAKDAGIPVVVWESDIVSSKRDTWVGSAPYDLGYTGGKKYAESINGQGKVAILSDPGTEMYDGRQEGYEAAFAQFPGIEIVAIGDTDTDNAVAVQAAKDILTAHPDLKGFVCCDATGPMGAVTAIDEAGLTGVVQVLGLDRDTAMLEKIKEGTVIGSVVQNDANMLFWAMTVLIAANYYDDAMLTTDNKAAGANLSPNKIACSINYIDQSNVDLYLAANQEYLK